MPRSTWPTLCSCLLLAAGCGGEDAKAKGRGEREPRAVRMVTTAQAALRREVAVHGTLLALDELVLGFQVSGRLTALPVDLGDDVAAAATIASLERRDYELERARAAAELAQAQAQLGLDGPDGEPDLEAVAAVREAEAVLADARQNRERTLELVQQSLRSPAELDTANAAFAVAQSRLQRARDQARTWMAELEVRRLQLAIADKRLSDTQIVAPWPGRVARRHVAVGQYVTAGTPVVTLLRTDTLRLQLEVPERQAGEVRVGQRVEFTVDGLPDACEGTVSRLGSRIDRINRTLLVEAAVDNTAGRLLPGSFCRARIVVADDDRAVVAPLGAVASFAGVDRLFTVEDGKAKEHIVTLGRRVDDRVEIVGGIAADTPVVDAPGDLTRDTPVRIAGN